MRSICNRAHGTPIVRAAHGDTLKIRVAAPPVDGAANTELRRFLGEAFPLPRQAVCLLAGSGSRQKYVLLRGTTAQR